MYSRHQATPIAAETLASLPVAVDPFALSLNENPFPPLPAVRSALIASIDAANRYPEFLPNGLRTLIAGRIGVPDEQVVLGAGASGVVMQALHAVTEPGDRIVLTAPTFDGYPIFAQMAKLMPVTVPLDLHGHHDLDAMADAASDAKVVVLCRPHNPTGTLESGAEVERFLQRVPPDTVVLLDEAYIEFVAPKHRLDAPALIRRFPNVVVLRTFSKAYGLAGLRIGYGFASPELAKTLWTMQLPFGMGITSTVAVAACYDAEAQLQQRIRLITDERRYLQRRLRAMGLYCPEGHANFVYLPAQRRVWRKVFDDAGLHVRHYANGAARITVGSRASTRAVLAAVAKWVAITQYDPTAALSGVAAADGCCIHPSSQRSRPAAGQGPDDVDVQPFVADPAVERLDVAVAPGYPGGMKANPTRSPAQSGHRAADQFGPLSQRSTRR